MLPERPHKVVCNERALSTGCPAWVRSRPPLSRKNQGDALFIRAGVLKRQYRTSKSVDLEICSVPYVDDLSILHSVKASIPPGASSQPEKVVIEASRRHILPLVELCHLLGRHRIRTGIALSSSRAG